jgi:HlyD family secretion protein
MKPRPPVPMAGLRARLACVGVSWLFALACGGSHSAAPQNTAKVERGRIERIVVATGTVEPEKEVEVRPRVPGIVQHILVKEGDSVTEGQVLVEIERDLLQAEVDEAHAALEEAKVSRRFAQSELERAKQLEHGGARSKQQVEDMQARFDTADAAVARAEARHKSLSTQLSYARVVSPLSGRVLSVPVEEGSAVSPVTAVTGGTLLLSLAATAELHLKGRVDENEVARIALQQPARIRTEAFPGRTFEGHVSEIAPIGERIQNVSYFNVKVVVTDADAQLLRPRMSGEADIVTEVVDDAVLVPETALRYRGDDVYVETADGTPNGKERAVKIGIVDGKRVQIVDGLTPEDSVVLQ